MTTLSDLLQDPGFVTGLGMLGSSQPPGPAMMQAAAQAQQMQSQRQEMALRQIALTQAKNRMNFNPSQYLLSNEQQNQQAPTPAPQTMAAMQAMMPQGGAQIADNAAQPGAWTPPQGAIGNVDMPGLLQASYQAGMGPEEAQQAAGIIDPLTAIRMRLMSQPALAVAPGASLVSPGMQQIQQIFGNGGATSGGGGTTGQPGALFTNNNPPPDSPLAQINMLTQARDKLQPGTPGYQTLDAAINKASGSWEQGNQTDIDAIAGGIASGKMAPLAGNAMRSPISQRVMARVQELNPNYNAHNWEMNDKAYVDFATGAQGNQVRSLNVAVNHLSTLSDLAAALQNGNVQAINKAKNEYKAQTGFEAPTDFNTAKNVVGDEVVKAVIGSGGAQSDRDNAQKVIDSANSPAQLRGAINTYQTLLGGQLNGLAKQYRASTGRNDFAERFLNPNTVAATAKGNPVQSGGYSVQDIDAELARRSK
jgi:hypothetical protein